MLRSADIIKSCFVAIVVGHVWFLSIPRAQVISPQLLLTGTFHGSEVTAQSGEKWLALISQGNDRALVETCVRITPIKDAGAAFENLKVVSTDLKMQPLFFIRGLPGVKPNNTTGQAIGIRPKVAEIILFET